MTQIKELQKNMPYSLDIEYGEVPQQGTTATNQQETVLIGSEIEPVKIENSEEGDVDNGESVMKTSWLIKQNEKFIIVVEVEEAFNYGCDYQKNGGYNYFEAYEVPSIFELYRQSDED